MLATIPEPVRTLAPAGFIERARALAPIDGRARHDWLPDGRTSLIFRLLDGGRRGDVCVAGPRSRARFKDLRGVARAVVLKLEPGRTLPLFGVAASELTDRIVPLTDLWGAEGRDLFERFAATADVPDLVDRATEALARRGQRSREPLAASLARRAARLLDAGELRVEDVAAGLGVSARHLRRAFLENVGVSPKEFARAARLQRALRLASTSSRWSRIAVDAGYYDQAHLITDFRRLVGATPAAFTSQPPALDLRCG